MKLFYFLCSVPLLALVACAPEALPTAEIATPPILSTATAVLPTVASLPATAAPLPTPTQLPTVTQTAPLPATPLAVATPAIVVIGDSQKQQVTVGETFILQGSRGLQWQIRYDPQFLTLLTTAEMQQTDGTEWLFQANEVTTQTVIALEQVPLVCEGALCPPPAGGAAIQLEAFIEIVGK